MLSFNKFFYERKIVVKHYKAAQMLVEIWALNNIIAYRLHDIYYKRLSNAYHYQNIGNLKKLLEQEGRINISKINTLIF